MSPLRMRVVVLFVIAAVAFVALGQYLVLQGVKVNFGVALPVASSPAQTTQQDLLEGIPHLFVPEGVDDGIDEGVALGQHQEVLLVDQHPTLYTLQAVEQQHHQAGRPADHKTAWEREIKST